MLKINFPKDPHADFEKLLFFWDESVRVFKRRAQYQQQAYDLNNLSAITSTTCSAHWSRLFLERVISNLISVSLIYWSNHSLIFSSLERGRLCRAKTLSWNFRDFIDFCFSGKAVFAYRSNVFFFLEKHQKKFMKHDKRRYLGMVIKVLRKMFMWIVIHFW